MPRSTLTIEGETFTPVEFSEDGEDDIDMMPFGYRFGWRGQFADGQLTTLGRGEGDPLPVLVACPEAAEPEKRQIKTVEWLLKKPEVAARRIVRMCVDARQDVYDEQHMGHPKVEKPEDIAGEYHINALLVPPPQEDSRERPPVVVELQTDFEEEHGFYVLLPATSKGTSWTTFDGIYAEWWNPEEE